MLWDGRGTANDGKPCENSYAWFMKMRDGKVVDGAAFYDSISFNELWSRMQPRWRGAGIRRLPSSPAALGRREPVPERVQQQPVPTPTWFAERASGRDDLAVASLPLYGRKPEVCTIDELIAFEGLWARVDAAGGR